MDVMRGVQTTGNDVSAGGEVIGIDPVRVNRILNGPSQRKLTCRLIYCARDCKQVGVESDAASAVSIVSPGAGHSHASRAMTRVWKIRHAGLIFDEGRRRGSWSRLEVTATHDAVFQVVMIDLHAVINYRNTHTGALR